MSEKAAPGGPAVPCSARIASFDPLDAVGTLRLADGGTLRFGRSACIQFEPVVDMGEGAPITLLELIPLSGDEYETVRREGSDGWLKIVGPMNAENRGPRWRYPTH